MSPRCPFLLSLPVSFPSSFYPPFPSSSSYIPFFSIRVPCFCPHTTQSAALLSNQIHSKLPTPLIDLFACSLFSSSIVSLSSSSSFSSSRDQHVRIGIFMIRVPFIFCIITVFRFSHQLFLLFLFLCSDHHHHHHTLEAEVTHCISCQRYPPTELPSPSPTRLFTLTHKPQSCNLVMGN